MPFPVIGHATVLSVDPVARTISVVLPSGQGISTVKPVYHGPADGIRVQQGPLPRKGTSGLCVWPYGDSRNGVWLGGLYLGMVDATQPGDADADYTSHWSGYHRLLTGDGQEYQVFPDGSYVSRADQPGVPAITRNVVGPDEKRTQVGVEMADRIQNAPAPRPYRHHHASGTEVNIDASGNTSVVLPGGTTLTLQAGGTTITVNPSGAVSVDLASGETLGVGQGSFSDFLVLASKFVQHFNTHTHQNNGSGPPTTQLAPADVNSAVIKVSA